MGFRKSRTCTVTGKPRGRMQSPAPQPNRRLAADQRAVAFLERPEGFIRRDRSADVVEVAGIFRFRRRFHLEQISRMHFAAVGADTALAKQRIVSWHLLHLRYYCLAVGSALQCRYRLEIVREA